jgi:hypothetical protein
MRRPDSAREKPMHLNATSDSKDLENGGDPSSNLGRGIFFLQK